MLELAAGADHGQAYQQFSLEPVGPSIALLGDIGRTIDPGFFDLLRNLLAHFQVVFFVPGNHEPFGSSWTALRQKLLDFQATTETQSLYGKFILLQQMRYDISKDVTILGCTLFSNISQEQREHVMSSSKDFTSIVDWSVDDHNCAHADDLRWLNAQVQHIATNEPERRIVILTHYSPTIDHESIDQRFIASRISSNFMTDLSSEVCWTSPNVKIWAFGHTHFNCDYIDERTGKRVVTNQRGYQHSPSAGFDDKKVLELQDA